jgi:hypothetical protein
MSSPIAAEARRALLTSLRAARKKKDYASVAALARALITTEREAPEAKRRIDDIDIELLLPEEEAELHRILNAFAAAKAAIRLRLGLTPTARPEPPAPTPVIEEPEPPPLAEPEIGLDELVEVQTLRGPRLITRRELARGVVIEPRSARS